VSARSPLNIQPSRGLIIRIWSAVIAYGRLLLRGVLIVLFLIFLFGVFPPAPEIMRSQAPWVVSPGVQFWLVILVLFGSGLALGQARKRPQAPDHASWSGVHAGILAITFAAFMWAPREAGFIAGAASLVAWTPWVLVRIAYRRARAGYTGAAEFCFRLACVLHSSRYMRFQSACWDAHALGQIEKKVAAYRALAVRAPPEHLSLLKLWIALAYGDWEGVLGQIRSADELLPAMKWLEIRALGELGRVDDMLRTYASLGPDLSRTDLQFCRLFILAFSGRIEGVRALLGRQLSFLRPRNKVYWVFVAGKTAGTPDEDARRALASYALEAEDESSA
jgi:hypothetical protein